VSTSNEIGFEIALGTEAQGRERIGVPGDLQQAHEPVTRVMSQYYCAVLEDANPSYWDERFATQRWGGLIAPPGTLHVWMRAPVWHPQQTRQEPPVLAAGVPLPGRSLINVATDTTFHQPIRVGATLRSQETIDSISPERETRLGTGHFVTTTVEYTDDQGARIATRVNTLLRFNPGAPEREGAKEDRGEALEHAALATHAYEFPVTYRNVAMGVAATMDYFRGHHDPAFAVGQGQRDVYLMTPVFQGLMDRCVTDWLGPETFVMRRTMRMTGSVYPGDTLRIQGASVDAAGAETTVDISMDVGGTTVCRGRIVARTTQDQGTEAR
jgi:acyl dehydratase